MDPDSASQTAASPADATRSAIVQLLSTMTPSLHQVCVCDFFKAALRAFEACVKTAEGTSV